MSKSKGEVSNHVSASTLLNGRGCSSRLTTALIYFVGSDYEYPFLVVAAHDLVNSLVIENSNDDDIMS
ncbi:hypothetical protein BELL_0036g00260 [Botrytis elliptica]|uniref:Uncharacterized protein n=1 Tax=Botrytis elliptica TaxID=278938 RepID=A0A4Z1KD64_9HELO|nr:hypothetical protein BELL_0036g00260 [Botrytis elliptica]